MATHANSRRTPERRLLQLTAIDRAEVERAVDDLLDILDTLDGDPDLEDGFDDEPGGDDEQTLGAPERHHDQSKWSTGLNCSDGEFELSLGAPEQHPFTYATTHPYFEAADGSPRHCRTAEDRQLAWVAGSRSPEIDEGESEPGYDLPEGDLEWDGEGEDREPSLGAPENHDLRPDQERWSEGGDEAERGEDEPVKAGRFSFEVREANRAAARKAGRQVEGILARKQGYWRAMVARNRDAIDPGNLRLVEVAYG